MPLGLSLGFDPAAVEAFFALIEQHFTIDCGVIIGSRPGMEGGALDLSSRLVKWNIDASINDACAGAEFTFARGEGDQSLSPLVVGGITLDDSGGSHPALDSHQTIVLNLTIGGIPIGTIFDGRIDRVNLTAGPGLVSVKCRDYGAYFLNTFMVEAKHYGSPTGVQVETVMRQMLEDNGWSAVNLGVPISPLYDIFDSPFGEASLLDVLRILAQQIGWDIRHFPQDSTFLRFYGPDRAIPFPELADLVFDKRRYEAITELSYGDEDVRNSWDGYYLDVNGVLQGPRHTEDAESIGLYGLRPARIFINRAENIRSDAAMDNFLTAALADTKSPLATHTVSLPLFPIVLLNDIYRFQANNQEYNTDFIGAVMSYRHEWAAAQTPGSGVARTTISLSGSRKAAFREYRRSVAPRVIVTTSVDLPTVYAPEGTIVLPVASLDFP